MKNNSKTEDLLFTTVYPALACAGAFWTLKSLLLLALGLR